MPRTNREIREGVAEAIASALQKRIDKGKLPGWEVYRVGADLSITLDEPTQTDVKARLWAKISIPVG